MKTRIIKLSAAITPSLLFIIPVLVFGQIANPLGDKVGNDIPTIISNIMGYVVRIGGIAATFGFIWSGFMYVKAQGVPAELAKAKDTFVGVCIGTAVLLGATLISTIITNTIKSLT